ncbi:hypothetical protein X741_32405 [Mesorhizobium sp. LNHC229A00]|nr:hypothetical protein X741_32405 [Mesorhizobium sp. LNHC229A00]
MREVRPGHIVRVTREGIQQKSYWQLADRGHTDDVPTTVRRVRRLLALASIYDGGSRADAARLGSVTIQIVRDWVVRFNARGPDGLINGKAPGKPSLLNEHQRAALAQAIERGPTPYLDGVVRWRLCDLAQWLCEEFRVSVSEQTLGREVRSMGYRKLSARPRHHAQDTDAAEALKKLPHRSGRDRCWPRQR